MKPESTGSAEPQLGHNDTSRIADASAHYRVERQLLDVPPGFERPAVGVIPEDWRVTPFGRLYTFTNGVNADKTAYGKGVRFINVLEPISYSHIYGPEIPGRVEIPDLVASAYSVRPGDIVFNRTSETDTELGLAAVYLGDEQVVFGGFVIRGRPIDDALDPKYSGYALRSKMIRLQIIRMGQGAVRANIGQQNLRRVLVAVPPLPEQHAIAEALSDVDGLIELLEKLIAKKRVIKQAAMQQLLTGNTRLPGFSGPWETKRLGEHVTFLRTGINSRAELTSEGSLKYLHYGDIHTSTQARLNPQADAMPYVPEGCARTLDRLRDGDLVFVDASEDLDGVGRSVEISGVTGDEVVAGLHTIAARFEKSVLADGFKAYLQFCPAFRDHLRRLAAGTKVYATNRMHIASVEIQLPRVEEQTAIATVLSDMDAEIAALERRRDKTRAIKQGMMQQLLTGRVRLVNPESAA
jgi:type I restriction enzyme S subunit